MAARDSNDAAASGSPSLFSTSAAARRNRAVGRWRARPESMTLRAALASPRKACSSASASQHSSAARGSAVVQRHAVAVESESAALHYCTWAGHRAAVVHKA